VATFYAALSLFPFRTQPHLGPSSSQSYCIRSFCTVMALLRSTAAPAEQPWFCHPQGGRGGQARRGRCIRRWQRDWDGLRQQAAAPRVAPGGECHRCCCVEQPLHVLRLTSGWVCGWEGKGRSGYWIVSQVCSGSVGGQSGLMRRRCACNCWHLIR
jgi:hypothetical protein